MGLAATMGVGLAIGVLGFIANRLNADPAGNADPPAVVNDDDETPPVGSGGIEVAPEVDDGPDGPRSTTTAATSQPASDDLVGGDAAPVDETPLAPPDSAAATEPVAAIDRSVPRGVAEPRSEDPSTMAADDAAPPGLTAVPPGLGAPADAAGSEASVAGSGLRAGTGDRAGLPGAAAGALDSADAGGAVLVEREDGDSSDDVRPRRPPPRDVDAAARLRDSFVAIEFDGRLRPFVDFVSDFSTIAITLDADVLPWLRVSPDSRVQVPATSATVAEVLKTGLEPLGLRYSLTRNQVWIGRPDTSSKLRSVPYRVEDLVGDPTGAAAFATRIQNLIAPDAWQGRGGLGTVKADDMTLTIVQSEAVHFRIIRYCEMLRRSRGLTPRSTFPSSLFELTPPWTRARERLERSVSLTFLEPTPLRQVVRHLGDASDTSVLIDWLALSEEGWTLDTSTEFAVTDMPLRQALRELLEPMGLSVRVIDEDVLQITTPQREAEHFELAFYALSGVDPRDGPEADELGDGAWLQRLQAAVGVEHFVDAGGRGSLDYDPQSGYLIASLPQSLHRVLAEKFAATPP